MRLRVLQLVWPVLLGFAVPPTVAAETADSVYINGSIYTVDDDRSWAEAVAIKNRRFVAVGERQAIEQWIGPNTDVIDLHGRMAMPGMHDAHVHLLHAGYRQLYECVLLSAATFEDLAAQLRACRPKIRQDSQWLLVHTEFDPTAIAGFDKSFLDRMYPDVAVYIRVGSAHVGFYNSRALAIAGITRDTPEPDAGTIVRDTGTGEPTGLFLETTVAPVKDKSSMFSAAEHDAAARYTIQMISRAGITSVQDSGVSAVELDSLRRLERAGELTQYVSAHILWGENVLGTPDPSLFERTEEYRSELIRLDAVKVWLDGSPLPPHFTHAPLRADGTIDAANLLIPADVVQRKVVEWDKLGLRVKMHASGEGATRLALNSVAEARRRNGDTGILHEIGHANAVSPEDMERLGKLDVVAEMSPGYGGLADPNDPAMATFWQFRTLTENGALLTAGSDVPVVPPNPFPWVQVIVSKPGESISLADALGILTRNGARVIGRDEDLGSIEAGKVANMIVLSQNLFDIPATEIAKTRVLKTVFQGRVVYEMTP